MHKEEINEKYINNEYEEYINNKYETTFPLLLEWTFIVMGRN